MMVAGVKKGIEAKRSESMDVKVLKEKGNSMTILIKDTNNAFVNALRRQIMAGTPIFAIEDVYIYENTGAMYDEMLAHRLGLIPLKMDSNKYKEGEKVKLVLEKEGPCTVYSKDIKSTDPSIEPVYLNIPITKLTEGQKIKIEMDAVAGVGKTHSKYQPAIVAYQELPIITSEKSAKDKSYKADIIEMIIDEKHRDLMLKPGQKIEYDPTTFIFTIESHGNLDCKELLESALNGLKERLEGFRKELKNL